MNLKDEAIRGAIIKALERFGGNQSKAAVALGMHRMTLRKELLRLGIPLPESD